MPLKKKKIVWIAAIGLILFGVAIYTLNSPTDAPSRKSQDYLRITRALSALQKHIEELKSAGGITPSDGIAKVEIEQAKTLSEGLIHELEVLSSGAIQVKAAIRSKSDDSNHNVEIFFVPQQDGKSYSWNCLGRPVSFLPTFCKLEWLKLTYE